MPPEITEAYAPVAGTPEYEAAMAAKVDESAAKALESANGTPPVVAIEEATEEAAPDVSEATSEEAVKEEIEAAGVNYEALRTEFDTSGALSEDSYKALEKAGFPKDAVDNYIAGQEARAELVLMKAAAIAGGTEQLNQMQAWAATSLTPAEIAEYNRAVEDSPEGMEQAIRGLRSRFEGAYGKQPALLGGRNASGAVPGYASRAEMTTDMRDPRYSKDAAFRAKVTSKVAATTAF